jgi:hypothetical protein
VDCWGRSIGQESDAEVAHEAGTRALVAQEAGEVALRMEGLTVPAAHADRLVADREGAAPSLDRDHDWHG